VSRQTPDSEHRARAGRIEDWLKKIRGPADVAIDLADVLYAGQRADEILSELLTLNLEDPSGRDRAADLTAELHAWLFGEMKHHLEQLEANWSEVEAAVEPK
jgi:hypothetical protein